MRTYVPVPQTGPSTSRPATGNDPLHAIGAFFSGLGEWFVDRLDAARRGDVEAYLSQATDSADLEHRIRRLERSAFFSRYY